MNEEIRKHINYDSNTGEISWAIGRRGVRKDHVIKTDNGTDYIRFMYKGKLYYAHRVVFWLHHGFLPENVDHINGDRKDNRIENLREASKSENQWNRKKCKRNTSGVKGAVWKKDRQVWHCQVTYKNKSHFVGLFKCLDSAKSALENKRNELHKGFANNG